MSPPPLTKQAQPCPLSMHCTPANGRMRKQHSSAAPIRRAVLALTVWLLALFAQSPRPAPAIAQHDASRSRDPNQKTVPSGVDQSPPGWVQRLALQLSPSATEAPASAPRLPINASWTDLAAIITGLIFLQWVVMSVGTYFLYKMFAEGRKASDSFRDTLRLSRQAFELARQSLILNRPPKLVIRSVEVRPRPYASGEPFHVFPPDSTVECRFLVRNIGASRATVLYSAVTLFLIPHSEPLPMVSPLNGVAPNDPIIPNMHLKPGEVTFGIFVRRTTNEESASVNDLYVLGWVDYVDEFGNLKHTSFCRLYVRGRFVPVEDPDYEDEWNANSL